MFRYETACINRDTIEYLEEAMKVWKECSKDEFLVHVSVKTVRDNLPWKSSFSLTEFRNDWSIRTYRSTYRGVRCYILVHSAIEFVYVDEKEVVYD